MLIDLYLFRKYGVSKILHSITDPAQIRKLSKDELLKLADELRNKTIEIVSKIGGHLGAGLGVVELTIALHYVFNTPEDILIWDVGHQTYPHKILTGRFDRVDTLRQPGGLSGFTKRSESKYDAFGAGHSSTSISAALGMAAARDMSGEKHNVIAVIGDGAMSAGMAYEAMNNAGSGQHRLIVILNDNAMSIAPAVGALKNYLARLIASKAYLNFRSSTKDIIDKMPDILSSIIKRLEHNTKHMITSNNLFEELGFFYLGPVDGHNLSVLVEILQSVKDTQFTNRPILIHVKTEKGKGFESPEKHVEKYHAVTKFDLTTKIQQKKQQIVTTYTEIFADKLIELAKQDNKIIAITAAMPSGTGLNKFIRHFPERTYDVAIAEQHAVTFAAGLACRGFKPYVAIYSTFLQRAYDQIIHDVAIQSLPVRFAIDRAGFVGADGPTHAGSFDIAYLSILPNFVVMAPSDKNELKLMMDIANNINNHPCAIRYPRGAVNESDIDSDKIFLGRGRIIKRGTKIAILNLGTRLTEVKFASDIIFEQYNINITIADARFAKPLDHKLIKDLAQNHQILITIEEGSRGGFGSMVLEYLAQNDLLSNLIIKTLYYPDYFMEHNTQKSMNEEAGLSAKHITNLIAKYLN